MTEVPQQAPSGVRRSASSPNVSMPSSARDRVARLLRNCLGDSHPLDGRGAAVRAPAPSATGCDDVRSSHDRFGVGAEPGISSVSAWFRSLHSEVGIHLSNLSEIPGSTSSLDSRLVRAPHFGPLDRLQDGSSSAVREVASAGLRCGSRGPRSGCLDLRAPRVPTLHVLSVLGRFMIPTVSTRWISTDRAACFACTLLVCVACAPSSPPPVADGGARPSERVQGLALPRR